MGKFGAWLPLTVVLAACGAGGPTGASGSATGGGVGNLTVVEHTPSADALQVPVDATVTLTFDGAVDREALNEDEISLTDSADTIVRGTYSTLQGGRVVIFKPSASLAKATDYTLTLKPTLCDSDFRTLDESFAFTFRTFDDVPPQVVSSSIANNATGVSRKNPILIGFDEALAPTKARATLKDVWGTEYALRLAVNGSTLQLQPVQDLPGSREFLIKLRGGSGGTTDRAGNALVDSFVLRFTTQPDTVAPKLRTADPANAGTDVSPRARLAFVFDESMDPDSYEPSSLRLFDGLLNPVPFKLSASPDKKTIWLSPTSSLVSGESYTTEFGGGATGLTDVSGNPLENTIRVKFAVGTDALPPTVATSKPGSAAERVSPNVQIEITFSEPIKPTTVHRTTVRLSDGTNPIGVTPTLDGARTTLFVTPTELLRPSTTYTLTIASGYDGLQDAAGNPMASDWSLRFTTSDSTVIPSFLVSPGASASAVPVTAHVTAIANAPLDPATVTATTFVVRDSSSNAIPGSVTVARGNRAIVFRPNVSLPSGDTVSVTLAGGIDGVHAADGNWRQQDLVTTFRIGFHSDAIPPEISLTVNGIPKSRNKGLLLPPSGFTIDASLFDVGNTTADPASLELTLRGPGSVPDADELFLLGDFKNGVQISTQIDAANALPTGDYEVLASVRDLSGNESAKKSVHFTVATAGTDLRPFERTQIVWAMFDSDREGGKGDGVADFEQDLERYGLATKGDPLGTNQRLRDAIIDGAVKTANKMFHRTARSGRKKGSVNLRLVTRQPCRAPHMKMAIGGFDPEGSPGRKYGSESTGILGRAIYDYRNAVANENNSGMSPGLGVFVGELFLFQARLYLDLFPHFITTFGRRFAGLAPDMGGTPAGSHPLDKKVLSSSFSYAAATPDERARYDAVMSAADDMAVVIGVILAHEIGHSIGMVAPGVPTSGLHGDRTLHNKTTGLSDVMGAVIGYESLVTIDFAFRPLNLAYLRERILLK